MLKFYTSKLCFVTLLSALCIWTATADASNQLRSAYLGPSVWNEDLSTREINDQLKAHFSEVLTLLEAKDRLSLLTALERAEATSEKHWSKADRQAALIFLAQNRRKQIQRLRIYKARGRFPLNEGQSTDAAPIFVDRNGTHCAVGHLMHLDGKNQMAAAYCNGFGHQV